MEEQQRVIGRTKANSVELSGAEKPPTAHISRVEVTVGHDELEIFRRSVPYGSTREHGLYFVAFSAERSRYDVMLARMFGDPEDGLHDRLTEFSRPVSGAYLLRALAKRPARSRRTRDRLNPSTVHREDSLRTPRRNADALVRCPTARPSQ